MTAFNWNSNATGPGRDLVGMYISELIHGDFMSLKSFASPLH